MYLACLFTLFIYLFYLIIIIITAEGYLSI